MRLISIASAILFTLSLLGISAARWIAQQTGERPFPLPDGRGCWSAVCVFDLPLSDLDTALNAAPDVVPGSARYIDDIQPPGERFTLRLAHARDGTALLLRVSAESYSVQRPADVAQPLLSLGDLIAALGPPDRVNLLSTQYTVLIYPARGLWITTRPTSTRDQPLSAYLSPRTPVASIEVRNPATPPNSNAVYYPLFVPWSGFGFYGEPP